MTTAIICTAVLAAPMRGDDGPTGFDSAVAFTILPRTLK